MKFRERRSIIKTAGATAGIGYVCFMHLCIC